MPDEFQPDRVAGKYDVTDSVNISANVSPAGNASPYGFEISAAAAPATAQSHVCINWVARHQL